MSVSDDCSPSTSAPRTSIYRGSPTARTVCIAFGQVRSRSRGSPRISWWVSISPKRILALMYAYMADRDSGDCLRQSDHLRTICTRPTTHIRAHPPDSLGASRSAGCCVWHFHPDAQGRGRGSVWFVPSRSRHCEVVRSRLWSSACNVSPYIFQCEQLVSPRQTIGRTY